MLPTIGIAICGFENNRQFVSQSYIHAIELSGGFPIILPCTDVPPSLADLNFCDGFLFCGGGDITPVLMNEEPLSDSGTTDFKTDLFHLSLMKTALASGKPILAICRGMQVLNVAMGGNIYQDTSLYPETPINHMQHSLSRSDPSHKVTFTNHSILYNICGEYTFTNSYHHQYIKKPARHLIPTGRTSDQVIESLESDTHPFVVGVQWHPECMYETSFEMQKLFHTFIHNIPPHFPSHLA